MGIKCIACQRTLQDAESANRGYGRVCWLRKKKLSEREGELPLLTVLHDQLNDMDLVCQRNFGLPCTNLPAANATRMKHGFMFGWGQTDKGGGLDLAYNALVRYGATPEEAEALHHRFWQSHIATLPEEGGRILGGTIATWVENNRAACATL